MTSKNLNPEFDEYLANAEHFARPIMRHLRKLLHATCPDLVEEIKWGIPHFDYKGEMMCIFAAHKKHCSFTFWKDSLMSDPRLRKNAGLPAAKRYLGRITALSDLPPDGELVAFVKEAMALNEKGVKLPPRRSGRSEEIAVPAYFAAALDASPEAKAVFEGKSASFRREYLVWITGAKTEATRQKRMDESLAWIGEGKGRFWKYEKAR